MFRSLKKASLLIAVLCVTLLLQGCVAQIMSAAAGILQGLGQVIGGPTGQTLGQIGQVLGGVGQAFGQQQQGVAGQLAGQAGGLLGGGVNPGQQPGGILNPGQQPGGLLNPGQQPGGSLLGINPTANPGQDALLRTQQLLQGRPGLTQQDVYNTALAQAQGNVQLAQQITQQILQQSQGSTGIVPFNPGAPPIPFGNGQGAPNPQVAGGQIPGVQIPGQAPQLQQFTQQANGVLQIANGVFGLINLARNNGQPQTTGGGVAPRT